MIGGHCIKPITNRGTQATIPVLVKCALTAISLPVDAKTTIYSLMTDRDRFVLIATRRNKTHFTKG